MSVPVLWLSRYPGKILARHYSDQGLLEGLLDRSVWRPSDPLTYEHREILGDADWGEDGAVVILPARHHATPRDVAWFLDRLDRLPWAVVILSGDEAWEFPWGAVEERDNRRLWTMQPIPPHAALTGTIPGGWYPRTRELLTPCADEMAARPLDWFFAGQITHARREAMAAELRHLPGGRIEETAGYLQETVSRAEYFQLMASAKIIPCPSGPVTVDTARAFEALEAGCVPILDARRPRDPQFDYWRLLFGEHPMPTINDWANLPAVLAEQLEAWPGNANRSWAFWQRYKRSLSHRLDASVRDVSGLPRASIAPDDLITVIVTTSPVARHPLTDHIEQTLDSIREQLPDAEIIVAADGIRPEQEEWRGQYDEYLRRLLQLTNFRYANTVPVLLDEWGHQANTTRTALDLVGTPLVLFVEHDTPLCGTIDWDGLSRVLLAGDANAIRLHFDVEIHPDQANVMLDQSTRDVGGVPLRRTAAWWQRPHLARADFYRDRILAPIPAEARTMIEEPTYARLWVAYADHGESVWDDWRVWIYTPDGNMQRSRHLDSREGHPKYGMRV